jgi:hypothetical protein
MRALKPCIQQTLAKYTANWVPVHRLQVIDSSNASSVMVLGRANTNVGLDANDDVERANFACNGLLSSVPRSSFAILALSLLAIVDDDPDDLVDRARGLGLSTSWW